jgi:hypothetical protein
VSRKGANPHPRRAKSGSAQGTAAATVSILPMEIQIGDRFTDAEGEWEVVLHREHPRHEVPPVPPALGPSAVPDPLHHLDRVGRDDWAARAADPPPRSGDAPADCTEGWWN